MYSNFSFWNMGPSVWPSLHFWSSKENMLVSAGVPFWLAEQTKPTQLKQLTSNAICWGQECCEETWEPLSAWPRQQASTVGRAASLLASLFACSKDDSSAVITSVSNWRMFCFNVLCMITGSHQKSGNYCVFVCVCVRRAFHLWSCAFFPLSFFIL